MKPWEIWTWKVPDAGQHPAVVLGTEERLKLKPRICVRRLPEVHEVVLEQADGLNWETSLQVRLGLCGPKS